MTVPEHLSAILSLSSLPDVVRQHATPKCAQTPITTVTIPFEGTKRVCISPGNWSPCSSNRRSPSLQHPTGHLLPIEIP
jgi:hypothetical protein